MRRDLERLRASVRQPAIPTAGRQKIEARLNRGVMVADELDVLIDITVHAAMLRQMIRSGPDATISHYSAVDEALNRKPPTPARTAKRTAAVRVCEAADAHLAGIDPTLQQLARVQEAAFTKLKEARAALRKFLPAIEADIAAALIEAPAAAAPRAEINAPSAMSPRARQALAAHLNPGRAGPG